MRIAIVGGAGFIGFHIARRMLDQGNDVSIIDDFSRRGGDSRMAALEQLTGKRKYD